MCNNGTKNLFAFALPCTALKLLVTLYTLREKLLSYWKLI